VIGLLEVTKAILPHFRAQKAGIIVNISSIGGKMTFPLGTLYHGTKFAVEGISESLHYELEPLGIKMKIVEPGLSGVRIVAMTFHPFDWKCVAVTLPIPLEAPVTKMVCDILSLLALCLLARRFFRRV